MTISCPCRPLLSRPLHLPATRTALQSSISTSTSSIRPNSAKIQLGDLTPSHLCYYWDTLPPDVSQLNYADKFFVPSKHSPVKLWSASKFLTTPLSSVQPEVAFLGRSNVGKSSLLNAIMGKDMCWTSSKPGRTREMNAFGIGGTKGGESKIVLLDMPGYGKGSRPEWGIEIMKYLQRRRQLCRAFVLVDSLYGLKKTDHELLTLFRNHAIPHQVILSKVDRVLAKSDKKLRTGASAVNIASLQNRLESLKSIIQPDPTQQEGPGALGEILTCSSQSSVGRGQFLGISAVRWAILSAVGFDGRLEVKSSNPATQISSEGLVARC